MQVITLKENVLSDNQLFIAPLDKVFKGGFVAIIKEYGYQNQWSDKLINELKFRKLDRAISYILKNYPELDCHIEQL